MSLVAFLALQAVTSWTMPGQGSWPIGDGAPIHVSLNASRISMTARASIDVTLTAVEKDVRVSPFLEVTRGIAFRVTTLSDAPVNPAEPLMGSPPPPPLESGALKAIAENAPLVVHTREMAKNLFPGPGRYKVSALVVLFDWPANPGRRVQIESPPITVTVRR